jgi:hypothetical protein
LISSLLHSSLTGGGRGREDAESVPAVTEGFGGEIKLLFALVEVDVEEEERLLFLDTGGLTSLHNIRL